MVIEHNQVAYKDTEIFIFLCFLFQYSYKIGGELHFFACNQPV